MCHRSWGALLVLLGAVLGPRHASAIIVTEGSLEWLCESHRHIGIAEVSLPPDLEAPDSVRALSPVTAQVTRRLRGAPPDSARIDCWNGVRLRPAQRQEILLFFDDSLRVDVAISLDDPESCTDGAAVGMDFLLLRSRQAILERVTRRLRRMLEEGRGAPGSEREARDRARSLTFELPARSEAFSRLSQGSVVYVVVPADSEYRERWMRELDSRNPDRRASAAASLAQFPGPEVIRRLKRLLRDRARDTLVTASGTGERTAERFQPVACAACQSLRQMHVEADCGKVCPSAVWAPRRLPFKDD